MLPWKQLQMFEISFLRFFNKPKMGTVKFSNPYQCPYHIYFIMNIDIRCYNNNAKKLEKLRN